MSEKKSQLLRAQSAQLDREEVAIRNRMDEQDERYRVWREDGRKIDAHGDALSRELRANHAKDRALRLAISEAEAAERLRDSQGLPEPDEEDAGTDGATESPEQARAKLNAVARGIYGKAQVR